MLKRFLLVAYDGSATPARKGLIAACEMAKCFRRKLFHRWSGRPPEFARKTSETEADLIDSGAQLLRWGTEITQGTRGRRVFDPQVASSRGHRPSRSSPRPEEWGGT